jgi:formylmethanofuran dehydrogenase subunit E
MKSYNLEEVGDRPRTDDERLADVEDMPDEKVARLHDSAYISKVRCEACGETTWLIGAYGHNSRDSCHHCGEEYRVVG